MHQIADFRSDTVTRPTPEMYEAMQTARLGDDVLGDDPTAQELEQLGARMLGKEAALFCVSGVQANQIAIHIHCRPGDEVIVEAGAHTYNNETGAIAGLTGAQVRPVKGVRGMPALADVLAAVRGHDTHHPRTRVVALENTHNQAGGAVLPHADVVAMGEAVKARGLIFHLDGARLANAAVATNTTMAELAAPYDTCTLCLSKGLGSPVGSLVAGSASFIKEARRVRKMFGGGMRQVGILAACGLLSLQKQVDRLIEDHRRARRLAEELGRIPGIELATKCETNIVYFNIPGRDQDFPRFKAELAERGVLALYLSPTTWRMVTHYDVDDDDVDLAVGSWQRILT